MVKILVIEDDPTVREEVADWLKFEGHEVIEAIDGVEGVNMAVLHAPALILCDISMPRLDGYEVLLDVRANSTIQSTPFIFISAKVDKDDIRKGMGLGADDYLTKPFEQHELMQAIQARLEKKAAQEHEDQQRLDSFKQALEMEHNQRIFKTNMMAMFVHDLRNQITVVLSSIMLLRDYAHRLDENRRIGHMNVIEAAARLQLQMLDDLLVMAEMETGHFTLEVKSLDVSSFLQGIVGEFQVISGGTHQLDFESNFSGTVIADARLLRQIAANLISNAIKYSPQGGAIRVLLVQRDGQCILSVQDQGIGISKTDQARIFEAFQRGKNVGRISGTGLGLAIVKQAVGLLGGTIHLESQVGVGTTMIVTIPVVVVD